MKKYLSIALVSVIGLSSLSAFAADVKPVSGPDEDTNTEIKSDTYQLRKAKSCSDLASAFDGWRSYAWGMYRGPVFMNSRGMAEDSIAGAVAAPSVNAIASVSKSSGDFSATNEQVVGVHEQDIVKTDGKTAYYYDNATRSVIIASVSEKGAFEKIGSIAVPDKYYDISLQLEGNRLAIVATGYREVKQDVLWWRGTGRTYAAVYDVSTPANPVIIKYVAVDGRSVDTRVKDGVMYLVSNDQFSYPYYYARPMPMVKGGIVAQNDSAKPDIEKIYAKDIVPTVFEASYADGKKTSSARYVGTCSDVYMEVPEGKDNWSNGYGYDVVTAIDLKNPETKTKSITLVGNAGTVFMGQKGLYVNSWKDSVWNDGWRQSTGVNKFSVDGMKMDYVSSVKVPGRPLTQWSMDESSDEGFRLITQYDWPSRGVAVWTFGKKLEQIGSLEGIANGEGFQASRFMGDKLFLVTFKQTDPLFVIDLANPKTPKVIGELKVPGFSTYLHPYGDGNKLLGLGRATGTNQWGGTAWNGIQLSLFDIDYSKNATLDEMCGNVKDVKVDYETCSKDFAGKDYISVKSLGVSEIGSQGSDSEALTNPRMFVWDASRKQLLLPISIRTQSDGTDNFDWTKTGLFNGFVAVSVNPDGTMKQDAKFSHVDYDKMASDRKADCKQYTAPEKQEPVCRKLLDGTQICSYRQQVYVPEYCYADVGMEQYYNMNSWKYQNSAIRRTLFVGDAVYAISDDKVTSYLRPEWSKVSESVLSK